MMNCNLPLVSICVPVYGVERYIERCAITLFEQTYENIEYVFVNDYTKDNSIAILDEVVTKYPIRSKAVRIINHKNNRGLAAARNTAVDNSKGEFILHVDSDDYIELDTVQLLVEEQQKNNADIVTCGMFLHKPNSIITRFLPHFNSPKEMTVSLIGRQTAVNIWGRLIKRSLYIDNNIKAIEGINMGEDYSVSPLLAYYSQKVLTLDKALYHYDCTNLNSYTSKFSRKYAQQTWLAFEVLENAFKNENDIIKKALDYGKVHIATNQIIACWRENENKDYYNQLKKKLEMVPRDALKAVGIGKRIVIYLGNWHLVRIYMRIIMAFR